MDLEEVCGSQSEVPIANANAGILFRVQDANNYYMYRMNVNDKKLELFKAVDGPDSGGL
ncbi:hypothetical protein MKZ24_05260 [Paenibacillus sp. FSL R7-0297]|uniref:hypothetical protein n=1 Tax=unclassified Paenibacillus TaxID=185978 RepID=UPI000A80BE0B|nr:hypothetical protein [Paenibacillus sp. FSL R5-0912]